MLSFIRSELWKAGSGTLNEKYTHLNYEVNLVIIIMSRKKRIHEEEYIRNMREARSEEKVRTHKQKKLFTKLSEKSSKSQSEKRSVDQNLPYKY